MDNNEEKQLKKELIRLKIWKINEFNKLFNRKHVLNEQHIDNIINKIYIINYEYKMLLTHIILKEQKKLPYNVIDNIFDFIFDW